MIHPPTSVSSIKVYVNSISFLTKIHRNSHANFYYYHFNRISVIFHLYLFHFINKCVFLLQIGNKPLLIWGNLTLFFYHIFRLLHFVNTFATTIYFLPTYWYNINIINDPGGGILYK